jgi:predicted Ser/Thr protein kinase
VSAEETSWPPSLFTFYLALREDGLMIHQFVLSQNTSSPIGNPYVSPQISCNPLTEVLYYPPKNFSGVDTFTYTVTNGNVTYNSTASVYVGIPAPSPTPTPTPTPTSTPSVTPTASVTPSTSPSPIPEPESTNNKSQNLVVLAASVAGGVGVIFCLLGVVALRVRKQRKDKEREQRKQEMIELSEPPTSYQPIAFYGMDEEASKRASLLLESRRSLKEGGWQIAVKDLKMEYEIGRGAFGVVHKGRWQGIDVAIKQLILESDTLDDAKILDFFGEAELMMKLKGHPNITQLLGICGDPVCLITEFVDNGSLKKLLFSECPLDMSLQIRIARDIAAGMLYLHNEGVIHRDLAARNILLDLKMRAKVSDFGMSRVLIDQADGNKTATDVGPIRWMAPEAMRQRLYNKKTDIWSYGVVLYEILTRKLPYHDTDLIHIATSVSLGELSLIPDIEKEEEKYPVVLVKILKMCLQRDPQDRPLFEDVIDVFDEYHVPSTPTGGMTPATELSAERSGGNTGQKISGVNTPARETYVDISGVPPIQQEENSSEI